MSDIFLNVDAIKLLQKKRVLFLGDSNVRGMYKDLLWLLERNTLIENQFLKSKLETSFLGDHLVKCSKLNKGRDFQEVREYYNDGVRIEFYFLTKCYSKGLEDLMAAVKGKTKDAPDLIVINSCLWDISRWGPDGVVNYKDNLVKLMKMFKSSLPENTLVVWLTSLPISSSCKGGFLIKQVEFLKHMLRFEVMEANLFAREVVVAHGFDVLDNHYYMRMQIHRRAVDGIHWLPVPVRHMTNLLLTHVALSWNKPLPGNFHGPSLERVKQHQGSPPVSDKVQLPVVPATMNTKKSPKTMPKKKKMPVRLGKNNYKKQQFRQCSRSRKNNINNNINYNINYNNNPRNICNVPMYEEDLYHYDRHHILNYDEHDLYTVKGPNFNGVNYGELIYPLPHPTYEMSQSIYELPHQTYELPHPVYDLPYPTYQGHRQDHRRQQVCGRRKNRNSGQNGGNIGPIKCRGQRNQSKKRPVPYTVQ